MIFSPPPKKKNTSTGPNFIIFQLIRILLHKNLHLSQSENSHEKSSVLAWFLGIKHFPPFGPANKFVLLTNSRPSKKKKYFSWFSCYLYTLQGTITHISHQTGKGKSTTQKVPNGRGFYVNIHRGVLSLLPWSFPSQGTLVMMKVPKFPGSCEQLVLKNPYLWNVKVMSLRTNSVTGSPTQLLMFQNGICTSGFGMIWPVVQEFWTNNSLWFFKRTGFSNELKSSDIVRGSFGGIS